MAARDHWHLLKNKKVSAKSSPLLNVSRKSLSLYFVEIVESVDNGEAFEETADSIMMDGKN